MDDLVLPVAEPFLLSYMHHSICFSMIDLNQPSEENWFISNFINLKCPLDLPTNRNRTLDFKHETFFSAYEYLFSIQVIHKNIIGNYNTGVIGFLMDRINEKNYIELMVNEYYIPESASYLKEDYSHNIFIYGYSQSERYFQTKYMKNGVFSDARLDFNVVQEAFAHANGTAEWSQYSKIYKKKNQQYDFNYDRFQSYVNDYIHSKGNYGEQNERYGLGCYDLILDYFDHLERGLTTADIRVLHFLWEHKKSMSYKISYLSHHKILSINHELVHHFKEMERDALVLRNFHLKNILSDRGSENIATKVLALQEKELRAYDSLIKLM